jgi:Flp pilus assembly protein TadG
MSMSEGTALGRKCRAKSNMGTSNRWRPRGQSLTELAVSLPMLLILLAGVVDIGRAYYTYLSLRDAAAEGAAYGSIHPSDTSGIVDRVVGESPGGVVDWAGTTVTTQILVKDCEGGGIQVKVDYNYTLLTPFIGAIAGSQTLPLSATVVNTILSPVCP